MEDKIKSLLDKKDILLVLLIVLVGVTSFGLGRLSVSPADKSPVKITYPARESGEVAEPSLSGKSAAAAATAAAKGGQAAADTSGKVVASKSGSKYHFPWCSGALRISQKNKIWFDSPAAAEAAGYDKASNCKGL